REIFNEGLQLPAVKYCSRSIPSREVEAIIGANSRTPELVLGDLRGQLGADRLGERRIQEAFRKYGAEEVPATFSQLFEVSEKRIRQEISRWNDGSYEAERFLDDDGIHLGKPVRVHVIVHKKGDRILFDFTQSADQTQGPANIRPPLVKAACAYCLIALTDPYLDVNSGLLDAVDLRVREGSLLNPRFPGAVNTYNPTVHATIDGIFEALSRVIPHRQRADGCGNRSIILGGRNARTGKSYIQYEIIYGGTGGRLGKDGISGCSVNHGNAKIAPVEIVESEFSVRLRRFELITDSGGAGEFRGGLGILREYENLQAARFSLRSSKHVIPPLGLEGGLTGRLGALLINPGTEQEKRLPTRYSDYPLPAGDVFRLETPGGGGLGNPLKRDPEKVCWDVLNGYVSEEKARELYGVVLKRSAETLMVDGDSTARLRESRLQ
ncbi:MAG TPA: hydantoinase B/oxoprolinase family protein, partial [bacterium]|nr:hydantoinase B/oxoprolinase family protein [bacterium]